MSTALRTQLIQPRDRRHGEASGWLRPATSVFGVAIADENEILAHDEELRLA